MELKIVRNWFIQSNIVIIMMYIIGIIFGIVISIIDGDANFNINFIFGFYPILTAMFVGNRLNMYTMYGYSRKQYFNNIFVLHMLLAFEMAVLSIAILEITIKLSPNSFLKIDSLNQPLIGTSIIQKLLCMFFYFSLIYSTIFFDTSRRRSSLSFLYSVANNFSKRISKNRISPLESIGSFGIYMIWAMTMFIVNMISISIITSKSHLAQIVLSLLFILIISILYIFGYKKLLKKDLN